MCSTEVVNNVQDNSPHTDISKLPDMLCSCSTTCRQSPSKAPENVLYKLFGSFPSSHRYALCPPVRFSHSWMLVTWGYFLPISSLTIHRFDIACPHLVSFSFYSSSQSTSMPAYFQSSLSPHRAFNTPTIKDALLWSSLVLLGYEIFGPNMCALAKRPPAPRPCGADSDCTQALRWAGLQTWARHQTWNRLHQTWLRFDSSLDSTWTWLLVVWSDLSFVWWVALRNPALWSLYR